MPPKESIIGRTFGKLTVIADAPRRHRQAFSVCRCICGRQTISNNSNLKAGRTKACTKCKGITHGMAKSSTYQNWMKMKRRCLDDKNRGYKNYGGRGITICDRWMTFENFLADMGKRPAPEMTLGRINNNKGYSKKNCRWETRLQQANNSRHNRRFTLHGISGTLAELCRHFGVKYSLVSSRLQLGWDIEIAMFASKNSL